MAVRPFPKAGPLDSIGAISNYLATLGEWTRQKFEDVNREMRTLPSVPYADLPPLAGLTRVIAVPDDPVLGQGLCFNGTATGTSTQWHRLATLGTAGGSAALTLGGQTITGTAGTTTQFIAVTINGTAGHIPFITT